MMLIIYYGEPVKVNIYSGTAVCEVNTKKDQFQEFTLQIVFWLQNITCGFIIICDWQHLGKLKISGFHFSEQSFWYASNCAKFSMFITNSNCSNFETLPLLILWLWRYCKLKIEICFAQWWRNQKVKHWW